MANPLSERINLYAGGTFGRAFQLAYHYSYQFLFEEADYGTISIFLDAGVGYCLQTISDARYARYGINFSS